MNEIPEKFWELPKYTGEIDVGSAIFVVFTIGKYPTFVGYIKTFHDLKQYNTTVSLNIFAVIVLQTASDSDPVPVSDDGFEDDYNVEPEIINLTNIDWILK